MVTLTGQAIQDRYGDYLQISNANAGIDATKRPIEDGKGTASKLELSTTVVNILSGFELNDISAQTGSVLKHEVGGVEADISAIADGGILVGDGAGSMAVRAGFLTAGAAGFVKHELGGIEADISAIADGGLVVGTGAGTMAIRTSVLTAGAAGFLTHEVGGLEIDISAITTDQFIVGQSSGVLAVRTAAQARTQLGFTKGADIASANPLVIGTDGDYFDVTGTTTIPAMTVAAGREFTLQFDAQLTLTHGANLFLGTAAIIVRNGDHARFYAVAANTVRLVAPVFFKLDRRRVGAGGEITSVTQPAFRATNLLVSNVTGDSSQYTIVFATEVFDQGADFDGTSTFTAPIAGRYLLTAVIRVTGMTNATVDQMQARIVTSNDTYTSRFDVGDWNGSEFTHTIAIIADMDSGDTAIVDLMHTGDSSGKVHDIAAGNAHFSGALLT